MTPQARVEIRWTGTARDALRSLPAEAASGLYRKVGDLRDADPRQAGKPLVGPLKGHYRVRHSRYRAVYKVETVKDDRGRTAVRVTVTLVAVGQREEGSRKDVYELAAKLIQMAEEGG